MRMNTWLGIVFLVACWFGLFQVKYLVRDIKKDVASLNHQLGEEQKAMHVLDAEWAHLIRPDRLEMLSAGHLGLVPVNARQMQSLSYLPARAEMLAPETPVQQVATPAPAAPPSPAQTVSYAR